MRPGLRGAFGISHRYSRYCAPLFIGCAEDRAGEKAMLRRLGLGVLLGAGLAGAAWAQGVVPQFDGQYTGELVLVHEKKGDCTQPPSGALYPLTISQGVVRFSYVPRFATTLSGRIAADGVFRASARAKKGIVQMTGRIQGSNVTAEIASPSCIYTFQTRK
jgi:hypothetical protein